MYSTGNWQTERFYLLGSCNNDTLYIGRESHRPPVKITNRIGKQYDTDILPLIFKHLFFAVNRISLLEEKKKWNIEFWLVKTWDHLNENWSCY